jgi:hypothetical protein
MLADGVTPADVELLLGRAVDEPEVLEADEGDLLAELWALASVGNERAAA